MALLFFLTFAAFFLWFTLLLLRFMEFQATLYLSLNTVLCRWILTVKIQICPWSWRTSTRAQETTPAPPEGPRRVGTALKVWVFLNALRVGTVVSPSPRRVRSVFVIWILLASLWSTLHSDVQEALPLRFQRAQATCKSGINFKAWELSVQGGRFQWALQTFPGLSALLRVQFSVVLGPGPSVLKFLHPMGKFCNSGSKMCPHPPDPFTP